jgi:1,2-diacylglycerol 3-alpha-glucosyltransferase
MNIGMFSDTYSPQVNGVVTMIKMLEENLQKRGHKVYIFTVDHPKAVSQENVYRVPSLKFPWEKQHRIGLPTNYRELIQIIKDLRIDIIHSHSSIIVGYLANLVAASTKTPAVTTYHTMMEEYVHYIPFMEPILKVYIRMQDRRFCDKNRAVIAPSIKIRKLLQSYNISSHIEVIPNGVDLTPFARETGYDERCAFRKRYDIGENEPVMIFIGRMGGEKSIDKLIENFARVNSSLPDSHFLLVGDGPLKGKLKDLASSLGVGDKVHFTGFLKWPAEISLAYQSSDLFIIASHTETFGLVTLEAMASGLPVVAYRDDSIANMVFDGDNGFMCDSKDELHSKIIEVLTDSELRQIMSVRSREISRDFSADINVERTIDLYNRVLNNEI